MFLVLCTRYHDQIGDTDAGYYEGDAADRRPMTMRADEDEADMWYTGATARGEDGHWAVWSELFTARP